MTNPRVIELVMALRRQGISDARVLDAIERTPRDVFVDKPFENAAYDNSALPIACGQTISQPYVVAFATQALEIQPNHRVLELGTGSGYQAAVLSPLCRMVYTVERHKPLLTEAEARFKKLGLTNIVTRHGDGLKGWAEAAPFDRILLSAAVSEVPRILIDQLKPAGILIAPVGGEADAARGVFQNLTKIINSEAGIKRQTLLPVMFVPMIEGLPQDARKADGENR
ncbi:MAG TPA: protein-L-isoaspartate(D-aspartate) O-methyltransferase [Rhizomicrobium sp.]|nr:protein-L-isoaspartate(D-aspartate) O-methyltransferase [Rhizomicrobium sp.]